MTTFIRPTDCRECDLCDEQHGTTATIYELWDDEVCTPRLLYICRRHAKNIMSALPLALRGGDDG